MRAILFALAAVAAIGFAGTSHLSAAPTGGAVLGTAANAGLMTEQIDCRRYPHRHKNAKPHGWGWGCSKKAPPKKTKTQKKKTG